MALTSKKLTRTNLSPIKGFYMDMINNRVNSSALTLNNTKKGFRLEDAFRDML